MSRDVGAVAVLACVLVMGAFMLSGRFWSAVGFAIVLCVWASALKHRR